MYLSFLCVCDVDSIGESVLIIVISCILCSCSPLQLVHTVKLNLLDVEEDKQSTASVLYFKHVKNAAELVTLNKQRNPEQIFLDSSLVRHCITSLLFIR
jgi:hypothetical protein